MTRWMFSPTSQPAFNVHFLLQHSFTKTQAFGIQPLNVRFVSSCRLPGTFLPTLALLNALGHVAMETTPSKVSQLCPLSPEVGRLEVAGFLGWPWNEFRDGLKFGKGSGSYNF